MGRVPCRRPLLAAAAVAAVAAPPGCPTPTPCPRGPFGWLLLGCLAGTQIEVMRLLVEHGAVLGAAAAADEEAPAAAAAGQPGHQHRERAQVRIVIDTAVCH
jgi:hypothetical protein